MTNWNYILKIYNFIKNLDEQKIANSDLIINVFFKKIIQDSTIQIPKFQN